MATQNYHSIKNAALIAPATATDLGSASQPYGNLYLQGNVNLGSTTITSTSSIVPKITSVSYPGSATAANPTGGETITINGTGFLTGISVYVNGTIIGSASVVSSTQVTFTSTVQSAGSYTLSVVNTDGGSASYVPGISYSALPVWSTAAGSLGSDNNGTAITTITLAAAENAQTITYAVTSGSLPPGLSLASNGNITGTIGNPANTTTYNFTVTATDPQGQTASRNFSYTVNVVVKGQQAYTTAGSYNWTAPTGVTSVSVVAIGGGGTGTNSTTRLGITVYDGTGGGGLGYKNNIAVTPGQSYTVRVGGQGTDSYFINTTTVKGGGAAGMTGGGYTGDGGGNGGNGASRTEMTGNPGGYAGGAGGGTGGYSGNGGNGGANSTYGNGSNGTAGAGGGGGGGGGTGNITADNGARFLGIGPGGGGGTGIFGQSNNGTAGAGAIAGEYGSANQRNPTEGGPGSSATVIYIGQGYGGGGVAGTYGGGGSGGGGASGAVRIIWPGNSRQFPSTRTADE